MKFNACLNHEVVKLIRQVKELHESCNSEKECNDALFAVQAACTTEKHRKRQYTDATKRFGACVGHVRAPLDAQCIHCGEKLPE